MMYGVYGRSGIGLQGFSYMKMREPQEAIEFRSMVGTIDGETFTMDNEGMVLVFGK